MRVRGDRGLRRPGVAATFLVGGFVPDHDEVRSLLVGLADPDRPCGLIFCGRVDHGQLPASRRRVRELLAPLVTGQSPFAEPPVFVRPALAVEVSFSAGGPAASATLPTAASPGYCRTQSQRGGCR
jgi:hypothetical protein